MKVMSDHLRLDMENPLQVINGMLKGAESFLILQVANVLADERILIPCECESRT